MSVPAIPLPRSRHLAFALLALALLLPPASCLLPPSSALAQSGKKGPSGAPMTDEDKAKAVDRRNYESDTDEAYKKTLQRIPDAPKADPWGGVREASKK